MPRKPGRLLDTDDIRRRVAFLIEEASQPIPSIRDHSITYTMRTISNFYSVGRDEKSKFISLNSRYRSKNAHALYSQLFGQDARDKVREKQWLEKVTNEHQEPLDQIWRWMCAEKRNLTAEQVMERFKQWPMVVVLKRPENAGLSKHKLLPPKERYAAGQIEVLWQNDRGEWVERP